MALDTNQQIFESLERSRTPLIALRETPSVDGISSAFALSKILKDMGKSPEVVAAGERQHNYTFLPSEPQILRSLPKVKPFVLKLDITKTKIDELTYDLTDGNLNLYLTPKEGSWKKEDLTLAPSSYRHDLIINLECPDLSALGSIFTSEPELWRSVPVINIDHDSANEHYGHINAVDITASSVAEILYPILRDKNLIDKNIATLLLAGIIGKTRSFKMDNVSPRALRFASELVSGGGERELIVRELYKTRDVPTLRLWGRAMSRLKFDYATKLGWTLLSREDFMHAGAGEQELPEVIHELLAFSKNLEVAVIIYEQVKGGICVKIAAISKNNALTLSLPWSGTGTSRETSFCIKDLTIVEVERQVIENLKKTLGELPK